MSINQDSKQGRRGSGGGGGRSIVFMMALLLTAIVGCPGEDEDLVSKVTRLNGEGRLEESRAALVEAIESGRKDPETLLAYGLTLSHLNSLSQAFWPLDAAMADPRFLKPAAMQLAQNAIVTQNFEIARRTMDRLLEEEPEFLPALVLRGEASLNTRRNYEEALADFEKVLEVEPRHQRALRAKATALLGLDRKEEALAAIEDAARNVEEGGAESMAMDGGFEQEGFWCAVKASFARDSQELEEAEDLYDGCLEQFPSMPVVVNEAIEFFRAIGRPARIEEILRAAVNDSPDDRQLRIALVLNLDTTGKRDEALELLRDATSSEDADARATAWLDLAGFLKDKNDIEGAIDAYQNAKNAVDEPSPELLFALSEALILAERYDEALRVVGGSSVEVHRRMIEGRVALERGDDAAALEAFTRVVTLWPDNAPARFYGGLAAERVGDFDRAVEEYRHTIRSDPNMMEGRQRLARLHLAEGDAESGLAMLRQSQSPDGIVMTAEARLLEYQLMGFLGRRIGKINNLPLEPGQRREDALARAYESMASGIRAGRGPAPTIQFLFPLIGNSPAPAFAAPFTILIEELIRAGQNQQALEMARRAVAAHPETAGFHASLALGEIAAAESEDAGRESLERALELDPTWIPALNAMGRLELSLGDAQNALEHFERALARDPADGPAAEGLVESLVSLGRSAEAEQRLEALLRVHRPFDGELALRLAELRADRNAPEVERTRAWAERARRFGAKDRAAKLIARLPASA